MSTPNEVVPIPVRNPYTGAVDYEITPPTAGEVAGICESLRAAQQKWAAAPLDYRVEVMLRWADELDAAYGPLSAADFADTGGCLIALMSLRIVASSVRSWAADAAGVLAAASDLRSSREDPGRRRLGARGDAVDRGVRPRRPA